MNKVALIIIYNHQYNKNIDILERIYKDKFKNIYHLVPFYKGQKQNVIAVYECSFYFQGYVAQGLKSYFSEEYTHYFFISDDLILNPIINENNYCQHLNLNENRCFLPSISSLHNAGEWEILEQVYRWHLYQPGTEASNQVMSYELAAQKFEKYNLKINPILSTQIFRYPSKIKDWILPFRRGNFLNHISFIIDAIKNKLRIKKYFLSYPLVGSYSDLFVINQKTIKEFSHYCGVFASTNLHVEVGLPTALVLTADEIVTENNLELQGKALWREERITGIEKYNYSLKNLLLEFPKKQLYIHPIKLSQWKIDI